MRFVILTQYFPPEIGGPQTRLRSMAIELRRLGHDVEVVTALPNYPRGKFFEGYEGSFYRREVLYDVVVHRVWLYPAMGGGFKRLLNYGTFSLTSFFGMFRAQRPDCIFVESPPILLSVTAYLAGLIWRVPFIFNVADLWPDIIVEGGFMKNNFIASLLYRLEKWSYRRAWYVNAVTEGLRDALLHKKSVPPEKVLFLPNGVDIHHFRPMPEDAALKEKLGLQGKKIILWAGTLGHAHGLEYVLQAAKLIETNPQVHFLFVGDGSAKSALQQLHRDLKLTNVTFVAPVSIEQLPPYFSIAECGLSSLLAIPLYDGARPSKFFPVLASGKPLIFVGKGEAAKLVQEARAGVVVAPENPQALADAVLQLLGDSRLVEDLGKNGRQFVEDNLQWSKLVNDWVLQLERLPRQKSLTTEPA